MEGKIEASEVAGLGNDPEVHDLLQPTRDDRGWFISPIGPNPWWTVLAALIPALLCTILIFMDQQITAVIVNRKEHRLKVRACKRWPRPQPTLGCRYGENLLRLVKALVGENGGTLPWINNDTGSKGRESEGEQCFGAAD